MEFYGVVALEFADPNVAERYGRRPETIGIGVSRVDGFLVAAEPVFDSASTRAAIARDSITVITSFIST